MRKYWECLYPILLVSALGIVAAYDQAKAGRIRTLHLKPHEVGKIFVLHGHSTALSFPSKPEKIVLGAPDQVHIEFINNTDINVTPQGSRCGNMHVYTTGAHYVLTFQMGSNSNYDDTVNINYTSSTRPLRLIEDILRPEQLTLTFKDEAPTVITALVSSDNRILSGDELFRVFGEKKIVRCEGCVLMPHEQKISCIKPLTDTKCLTREKRTLRLKHGRAK